MEYLKPKGVIEKWNLKGTNGSQIVINRQLLRPYIKEKHGMM